MAKYKQAPSIRTVGSLKGDGNSQLTNGKWYPARYLGLDTLRHRLKCAWIVFTGKGDVIIWPDTEREGA